MVISDQVEEWFHWVGCTEIFEGENPVDVADYSTDRGIDKEPVFAFWVPYTLSKSDFIVSEVSLRVQKLSQKYGIEIPTPISHAKSLHVNNGNTYWMDTTTK